MKRVDRVDAFDLEEPTDIFRVKGPPNDFSGHILWADRLSESLARVANKRHAEEKWEPVKERGRYEKAAYIVYEDERAGTVLFTVSPSVWPEVVYEARFIPNVGLLGNGQRSPYIHRRGGITDVWQTIDEIETIVGTWT